MKWITIDGFENYEVSENGDIRNVTSGRILKHEVTNKGYHRVCLCQNGVPQKFRVHRLVLAAFAPVEGMEQLQVNHKDENKDNNNIDNLEWCTAEYNNNYGTRNKRIRKPVEQYDMNGKLIAIYESQGAAARELGIQQSTISAAMHGKCKTAGGYTWKFVVM